MKILLENTFDYLIMDDEDFHLLQGRKPHEAKGYARVCINYKLVSVHKLILPNAVEVDHRDRNKLNNRRSNLREVTHNQNQQNRESCSKSGYKGVYKTSAKYRDRYQAQICVNYKMISLGTFNTPEDAARAYNEAALIYYGEDAYLNAIT